MKHKFWKAILPKGIVSFIQGCRYRGFLEQIDYLRKVRKYRLQYFKANAGAPDSTVVLPAGCRIVVPSGPDVRHALEHFGWMEPLMVDEFISFMKLPSDAKVLWDIGALYGVFALAFALADPDRRALAFEPNPSSRGKLEECLPLNPTAKIQVFDFAVGKTGEVVEFESGFHYTAVAGLPSRPSDAKVITRETVSIDQLIDAGFEPPDVIKIDVEGHEFEVLQGARKLLLGKKPILSIELHPGALVRKGTSALAIAEFLEEAGYVFRDMRHKRVGREFFQRGDIFRIVAM
jgi:FkbM family methyltransferase